MSDKPRTVRLVTSDDALRSVLTDALPADLTIATHAQDAVDAPLLVDAASGLAPSADWPSLVFYDGLDQFADILPGGIYVRKPVEHDDAVELWRLLPDRPAQAQRPADRGAAALPLWVLDLHALELRDLCHALVTRLPREFGYEHASLYLHDATRGVLSLAESTCRLPVELAISLSADPTHPFAVAARLAAALRATDFENACASLGARVPPEPSIAHSGQVLLAPLHAHGALEALLVLSGGSHPPICCPTRKPLLDFFGQSVRFARQFEQVRLEARIDGLTGLFNYRWMLETVSRESLRAERHDTPLSLLMIDLDGLKAVNDTCGHLAGDQLLRHVSTKIRATLRQIDSAARTGGDEFVILLPSTDAAGAVAVAERLAAAIRSDPAMHGEQCLRVSASVGVAQWKRGWTAERLLEAADRAMYAAKRGGRDGVRQAEE